MKIFLRNKLIGLIPLYPSDYEEKRKLILDKDYLCELTNPRNIKFHNKFMAMVNLGHENTRLEMPFEAYRKYLTIKAGFFKAYQTPKGIFYEADSLSFANMEQNVFEDVYNRVLDEIIKDIGCEKEDILEQLINFS